MTLDTSSKGSEFEEDVDRFAYSLRDRSKEHGHRHIEIAKRSSMGIGYNNRRNYPDQFYIATGFSVAITMLYRCVDMILECEDRIAYLDEDEMDSEEYQHALGELFAAKTVYLTLCKSVGELEIDRLDATATGLDQMEYLNEVIKAKGAVGMDKLANGSKCGELRIGTPYTTPSYKAPFISTNYIIQAQSPSLSATPPAPPSFVNIYPS